MMPGIDFKAETLKRKLAEIERLKEEVNENGELRELNDQETLLLFILDIHEMLTNNPCVYWGEVFGKYPRIALFVALVAWTLSGATVLSAIAVFLAQLGLHLQIGP